VFRSGTDQGSEVNVEGVGLQIVVGMRGEYGGEIGLMRERRKGETQTWSHV
jgi:hypothetical protein